MQVHALVRSALDGGTCSATNEDAAFCTARSLNMMFNGSHLGYSRADVCERTDEWTCRQTRPLLHAFSLCKQWKKIIKADGSKLKQQQTKTFTGCTIPGHSVK